MPNSFRAACVRGIPLLLSLWCGAGCLYCILGRKPWATGLGASVQSNHPIPLADHVAWGLWWGSLLSCVLGLGLLLSRRWWLNGESRSSVATPPAGPGMRPLVFWTCLAAVAAGGLALRWPRMAHSFWGDEAWAFEDYVLGLWKPATTGGSYQDPIKFRPASWMETAFSDRGGGNNHWMFSLLQKASLSAWRSATGRKPWEFDETVGRLVPLAAGLGSLVAMAWLLRCRGRPGLGLLSAALLAVHPWHVRFSTEARGYSLMILFLILNLHFLLAALEKGRLRHWAAFGLGQFAVLYSWKGAVYPLLFLNLFAGICLLRAALRDRCWTNFWRWAAANAFGAMLFLPLYGPSHLQIMQNIDMIRNRAKPMGLSWIRDVIACLETGTPWHLTDAANPNEVALQRSIAENPAAGWAAIVVLGLLLCFGAWRLRKTWPALAGVCAALAASGVVAACHFKWGLHVELLTWYLFYLTPVVALLMAAGLTGFHGKWPGRCLFAAGSAAVLWLTSPMNLGLMRWPSEDFRGATELTRGRHETLNPSASSKIYTAWLWRYTTIYDPRGSRFIRRAKDLAETLAEVDRAGGEFYIVVGNWELARMLNADLLAALEDSSQFELLGTLWAEQSLQTLRIFHWKNHGSTTR